MPEKHIEIHHDDVEDILGRTPGWITRYGMIVFMAVIFLLVTGAWVFKIPDVKKAKITLTSLQPPAAIEARAFGKIEKLFVKDNQYVEEGDILAEIENSADLDAILALKSSLEQMDLSSDVITYADFSVNGDARFGSIQADYAQFNKNFREYLDFIALNYHDRKISLLEDELLLYQSYSEKLDARAAILEEELKLATRQFERDSVLFLQGVVSESDYENSQSVLLQKRNNWQEILGLNSENDIKISGIRDRILELELRKQEEYTAKFTSMEEAYNKLKASLAQWEKQYLIVAPVEGAVTFNQIWSENQNVETGEKVMTIIPGNSGELLGKILLPIRGAGEVKEGQKVNIRFENYPYLEYGMVRGIVLNVSKVPDDEYYTVEVSLPDGLITYYGVQIDFHQNMQGDAEILTDHMRLLQRIFNPVKSAVSRQKQI